MRGWNKIYIFISIIFSKDLLYLGDLVNVIKNHGLIVLLLTELIKDR